MHSAGLVIQHVQGFAVLPRFVIALGEAPANDEQDRYTYHSNKDILLITVTPKLLVEQRVFCSSLSHPKTFAMWQGELSRFAPDLWEHPTILEPLAT